MILTKIKAYIYSAIGLIVTGLIVAVKFLASRNRTLKRKAESAEARWDHAKNVMSADKEADEQEDIHLAEVAKEVEEGKHPDELKDSNNW